MDKILEQSLLFDFYGELLTEHQKEIYEDYVLNDLSLGEVADARGISRQAVYDVIRRSERQLQEYEDKLQLVRRFIDLGEKAKEIKEAARLLMQEPFAAAHPAAAVQTRRIEKLADEILHGL